MLVNYHIIINNINNNNNNNNNNNSVPFSLRLDIEKLKRAVEMDVHDWRRRALEHALSDDEHRA